MLGKFDREQAKVLAEAMADVLQKQQGSQEGSPNTTTYENIIPLITIVVINILLAVGTEFYAKGALMEAVKCEQRMEEHDEKLFEWLKEQDEK